MKSTNGRFEFIVIGAGLAGLYTAHEASKHGSVALIAKSGFNLYNELRTSCEVSIPLSEINSVELHIKNTLRAGRGLCRMNAVKILAAEGKEHVKKLIDLGLPVDGEIITGETIKFFAESVKENNKIEIYENCLVYHLMVADKKCSGVYVYDWQNKKSFSLLGSSTILATGGCSSIYGRINNPNISMGEEVALAYNAGADIENMEFVKFHPTSFTCENGDTFLISEAVRTEGAFLLNSEMERFMLEKDELAELAANDIVSQSIYIELKKLHKPNVFLDLRHLDPERIKTEFPAFYSQLLNNGIDVAENLVPVVPAARYMIGGIKTGIWGDTNIQSLYAVGEISSTGIHGGNLLDGNLLLECLVFSSRAVQHSIANRMEPSSANYNELSFSVNDERSGWFNKLRIQIASIMMNNVGVVRIQEELNNAINKLSMLRENIPADENEYYANSAINLVNVALLITTSALIREESRGCHFRDDFTNEDDKKYIVVQNKFTGMKFYDPEKENN